MRLAAFAISALLIQSPAQVGPGSSFDRQFTGDTMRVDYFHTGGPKSGETISLDRVVNDGPWAGSRTQLVDPTNLGKYRFEVRDKGKGTLLYSRGFASVYGEWETTSEQKIAHRTFHESLRFPWPKEPVAITLSKRQADNSFSPIWTTDVDPRSRFVDRAPLTRHAGRVWPVFVSGPPADKVDLLVIGEGYTAAEMSKFHARRQSGFCRRCSRRSRSRAAVRISTFARSICRPPKVASTGRTPACSGARRCRPSTTSSIPNATCSRSTTGLCVTRRRPRRTNSLKSS